MDARIREHDGEETPKIPSPDCPADGLEFIDSYPLWAKVRAHLIRP